MIIVNIHRTYILRSQNLGDQNCLSTNGFFMSSHMPPNVKEYPPDAFGRMMIRPSLGESSRYRIQMINTMNNQNNKLFIFYMIEYLFVNINRFTNV
jgi:hypothetical protein